MWVTNSGKNIHLKSTPLTKVCDIERLMLDKLAQEKLQQLGIALTAAPSLAEQQQSATSAAVKQTKRKVLLLKRKAVTTGLFESKSKEDCSSKGEKKKEIIDRDRSLSLVCEEDLLLRVRCNSSHSRGGRKKKVGRKKLNFSDFI